MSGTSGTGGMGGINGMSGMGGINGMGGLEAARQVNRRFGQLCELTYRCLQVCDADEPDMLTGLLEQRQAIMCDIDRLQSAHEFPGAVLSPGPAADATESLAEPSAGDGGLASDMRHVAAERRDLVSLLTSLDDELVRLSTIRRNEYHVALQKALNPYPGPAGRIAAGRLFSQMG